MPHSGCSALDRMNPNLYIYSGRNKEKLAGWFFFTILRKRSHSDHNNQLGVWGVL